MDNWLIITLIISGLIVLSVLIFSVILLAPRQKDKVKKVKLEYVTPRNEPQKATKTVQKEGIRPKNRNFATLFVIAAAIIILEIIFLKETFALWELILLCSGSGLIVFSLTTTSNAQERAISSVILFVGKILVISALFNLGLANNKLFLFILGLPIAIFLLYIFFNFMRSTSFTIIILITLLGGGFILFLPILGLIFFGGAAFILLTVFSVIAIIALVGRTIFNAFISLIP